LVEKARPDRVIVAPDKRELGTNALVLAPPLCMNPRFGERSYPLHVGSAASLGASPLIHRCVNFARDIDEPGDLPELLEHPSRQFDFLSACMTAEAE
jgi:2-phospho-L-lactate guanylyltransferase (CobY/MobA/RfbA family)